MVKIRGLAMNVDSNSLQNIISQELVLPDGIKPYYNRGGIAIIHGDCRDILPQLEPVDLVLTDPPYGMQFRSNHRRVRYGSITNDDYLPLPLISLAISKATRAAYVFCRWNNLPVSQR